MKTLVIYKSKSGFVRKYAEWIGEALEADVVDASKITSEAFGGYDTIVYGGGLYAVGINGVKVISNNLDRLEGKTVIVFASGASPKSEKVIEEVKNRNFTMEQQKKIHFFYLRGGFDYSKLGFFDKTVMLLMKFLILRKVKQKKELNADERGMLATFDKPVDFTSRKSIEELVNVVKVTAKN